LTLLWDLAPPELPRPKDAARVPENYYGIFSYTIISNISKSNQSLNYRDIFRMAESRYSEDRPGMPPRIAVDGELDRAYLGFNTWPAPPRLTLSRSSKGSYFINGGELQGLVDGSVLALHPSQADPTTLQKTLGYVRVKNLGPTTAEVELIPFDGRPAIGAETLKTSLKCALVSP
jgi:hypothetical protein